MSAVNVAWDTPTYDKAQIKNANTWCVIKNIMFQGEIIKTDLTEEEADAWLKLLRG